MKRALTLFAAGALTLALAVPAAFPQNTESKPSESRPPEHAANEPHANTSNFVTKTYYLANISEQNDANELLIALRNSLDRSVRIYLVPAQRAIVLTAPPDQQALAQKILSELDRPRKIYRLTFTLADSENGKRVGIQHISMIVAAGQRTVLKQGDKIPVATGTYGKGNDPLQTQFQYLDVGMNIDATLEEAPNGLQLKSKIEESSLGQPSTIAGVEEPVVRQSVIEGTSRLAPGKPLTLGSVDVTGTTRHLDIEVVAEPIS